VVHWAVVERGVVGHHLPAHAQGDAHVGEEGRCTGTEGEWVKEGRGEKGGFEGTM
jgi:hypothetical protein